MAISRYNKVGQELSQSGAGNAIQSGAIIRYCKVEQLYYDIWQVLQNKEIIRK